MMRAKQARRSDRKIMTRSRRQFLKEAARVAVGFGGLRLLSGCEKPPAKVSTDPKKIFNLAEGFEYQVLTKTGQEMDDGLLTPGAHDGMAAFPFGDGKTLLICNHELTPESTNDGAFGKKNERLSKLDPRLLYDYGKGKSPGLGGTTSLIYDTRTRKVERHWLSLAGTHRNCAGGPTPWASWITCEETTTTRGGDIERDHGYNFEVPADALSAPAAPIPLKAMGRFNHEAVAVDPDSLIVYQTEDRDNGQIYRYIPHKRGQLLAGGRLQALRLRDKRGADTRNWYMAKPTFYMDQLHDVEWVDLEEVESPEDDLRLQGYYGKGTARFARGEGMWYGVEQRSGKGAIYFACTSGGRNRKGQIWRYYPSRYEGMSDEEREPGKLELFVEPDNGRVIENCDNITFSPWGDVIVCEDQDGRSMTPEQNLLGISPQGIVYRIGTNALNDSELAGACFSPDGGTLFVNIQRPGITLAIWGPWKELAAKARY
jgi:hypothetical protein